MSRAAEPVRADFGARQGTTLARICREESVVRVVVNETAGPGTGRPDHSGPWQDTPGSLSTESPAVA